MKIQITALLCAGFCQLVPAQTIPDFARADLVLGQPNFTTNTYPDTSEAPLVSATTMSGPADIAIDPMSGKLFVAEYDGYRILRFADHEALANGASAEAVFGQPDFASRTSRDGANGLGQIAAIHLDRNGRLWVADRDNNRVLMFDAAIYRSSTPSADRVYGQPDFATTTSGVTASEMDRPGGVFVDLADRLWVADSDNNRVLRFDSISTKPSGAAANGVLGQPDFTSSTEGSGSTGIQEPWGISVSQNGSLFVACAGGNRVLRFDEAASLANGAPANVVLGQPDFSTISEGISASKLNYPYGLHLTNDDALWVTDYDNHRVVRFNKASEKATGSAADGVVGQADLTSNTSGVSDRNLFEPSDNPFVDTKGNLWVPDYGNNRVLRFPPDVKKPKLRVTSSIPKSVKKKKLKIKGTAADAYGISGVYYRIGSSKWKEAKGTTSWSFKAKLKKGKTKIRIQAVDSVGNKSLKKTYRVKR